MGVVETDLYQGLWKSKRGNIFDRIILDVVTGIELSQQRNITGRNYAQWIKIIFRWCADC